MIPRRSRATCAATRAGVSRSSRSFELDRVLAAQGEKPVEIAPAAGNPNTAGTARTDTKFRVGDRFTYRVTGRKTGDETRDVTWTITAITDDEVIFDHGRMILDLLGNIVKMGGGLRFTPRQDKPLDYVVGKKWSTRFGVAKRWRDLGTTDMEFKVDARETAHRAGRHFRLLPGGSPRSQPGAGPQAEGSLPHLLDGARRGPDGHRARGGDAHECSRQRERAEARAQRAGVVQPALSSRTMRPFRSPPRKR